MSFLDKLWIRVFCRKIGEDEFGNLYYIGKSANYLGKYKRYVYYNGSNNSSKVPPMWHAWLHYLSDDVPSNIENYQWQKTHQPNLTGTKHAYRPTCTNPKLSSYSAWAPKK